MGQSRHFRTVAAPIRADVFDHRTAVPNLLIGGSKGRMDQGMPTRRATIEQADGRGVRGRGGDTTS